MKHVVRIQRLGEEQSDLAYWLTQPIANRLAAVEELRAFVDVLDVELLRPFRNSPRR